MPPTSSFASISVLAGALALGVAVTPAPAPAQTPPGSAVVGTIPGMPEVPDPHNLYSETGPNRLSPKVASHLPRIYVPSRSSSAVLVLDPATRKLVETLRLPGRPRFVVPSWDLKTLWVVSAAAEGRTDGSLTPIDPATGKPGKPIPVDAPHNLYWTADGRHAIVVARALKRLDFRDARSMVLEFSIQTPDCDVSHAEVSISGRFAAFTCEDSGAVTKVDLVNRRVVATLKVSPHFRQPAQADAVHSMPQDVRLSPDGRRLYVSDLTAGGLHVVDFAEFRQIGFIPTAAGAHGLYPSRDGKRLYVANRGSAKPNEGRRPNGSVSVLDFGTGKIAATWPVPAGGSPDMGTVSADGRYLWLAARYDDEVYRFDTVNGSVATFKLGQEPHGLLVWPQPGRYSLGYTGLLR